MKTLNNAMIRLQVFRMMTRKKLRDSSGQFVMDHTMIFVIILVLGGIALGLLAAYLRGPLSESLKAKISDTLNFN